MRGNAISSGENKIILKHFETENSSLNENAVITMTFKVPRIVKHEVKSPNEISPNRKKEFNKLDKFNPETFRHMINQFYARGESLANIYFLKPKFHK